MTYALLEGADFSKPRTVKKILGDLHARLKKVKTREDLVAWLQLHDEVQDVAWEQSIKLEIAHTADTQNQAVKAAYDRQVNKIDPAWEEAYYPILVRLSRKAAFKELPKEYNVFRQSIYSMLRGATEKNSALQTKETRLAGEYDDVVTQLTVSIDGKKITPHRLRHLLEGSDRQKRQEAWEKEQAARLSHREQFNDIFLRQVDLRQQQARNARFTFHQEDRRKAGDYLRFNFSQKEARYTPEDIESLHQAIADHIVPFVRSYQEDRRKRLVAAGQLHPREKMRPWDLTADPGGRTPLQPFQDERDFSKKLIALAHTIDPRLSPPVTEAVLDGRLDIADRKGKTSCYGFCHVLPLSRLYFACVNNTLSQEGLGTAVHEILGHGSHAHFFNRNQRFGPYRNPGGIEVAELASMSMELMATQHMDVVYRNPMDQCRAQRHMIEGFFNYVIETAATDAFQHWVYRHPQSSQEERDAAWLEQMDRFGGIESWKGHEEARQGWWQRKAHLFNMPLYAEYLPAAVGALQMWSHYLQDPKGTVDHFIRFTEAGGSRTADKLYQLAGIRYDPQGKTLAGSMAEMEKFYTRLRMQETALEHEKDRPARDLGGLVRPVPVPSLSLPRERHRSR